jgi:uncharacterized protein (TIGR03118 family)
MRRQRSANPLRARIVGMAVAAAIITASAIGAASASARPSASSESNSYVVHNLVSDIPGRADFLDPDLVNAWGLAALPTSPWWVADNGTDVSTLYRADGSKVPLTVEVPNAPTGTVANSGSHFVVSKGSASGPALFIFSTEEGTILGWNPSVDSTHAVVAVPASDDAVYKGLAIALTASGDFLYATDFRNARVDVFDGSFNRVNNPGAFVDPGIPAGYAPFGIQNIGGQIFVTYAKQDAEGEDDVAGPGHGFVDVFDTSGAFLGRVASRGPLNSPWGLALAPDGFGRFGGDLLVGNFGDGRINAYQREADGTFSKEGTLRNPRGNPIAIPGLWALQFGMGAPNNGSLQTLFFTAGPADEEHGLFGTIRQK